MTYIDLTYTAELSKTIPERALPAPLFYGDNQAHRVRVQLQMNGAAVSPEGVTAAGYFMRSDGRTVYMEGTVDGSTAEVVLSDECYRYTGAFTLILRLTGEVQNMTVLALRGTVAASTSETVITSTKEIYNLTDLLDQLTDLNDMAALLTASADRLKDQIFSIAENLLDNTNFCLPVNQTGSLVYTLGDITYLCDRWQLPDGAVTGAAYDASAGITLEGTGDTVALRQTMEKGTLDESMAYTGAVYFADGTAETQTVTPEARTASDDDATPYTAVTLTVPLNRAIRGVALFAGLYTADTLPSYQWRGTAAELAACRRWFIRWSRDGHAVLRGYEENGRTQLCFAAPEMRGAPRVAQVDGSCTVYCSSATAIIAAGSPIVCGTRTAEVINGLFVLTNSTALNGTNHYPVTMILSLDAAIDFTADFE